MRLYIRHKTTYTYAAPLTHAIQRLCLTPRPFETQKTLKWSIEAPGFGEPMSHVDCFGNMVHVVTAASVKGQYSIVAEGIVESLDSAGVIHGIPSPVPDAVFLRQTKATAPSLAMADWLALKNPGINLQTLHDLSNRIHEKVVYVVGATDSGVLLPATIK